MDSIFPQLIKTTFLEKRYTKKEFLVGRTAVVLSQLLLKVG